MSGNKGGNGVQPRRLPRIEKNVTELESQTDHREKKNDTLDDDDIGLDSAIKDGLGARNLIKKFGGGFETESSQRAKDEGQKRAQEAQELISKEKADRLAKEKAARLARETANEPFIQREAGGGKTVISLSDPSLQTEPSLEQEYKAENIGFSSPLLTSAERVTINSLNTAKHGVFVAPTASEAPPVVQVGSTPGSGQPGDGGTPEPATQTHTGDAAPAPVTSAPEAPPPFPRVPEAPSRTFVKGPHSVIGEDDALTRLLKHIKAHPEAQNYKSIGEFQNTDLPLQTSKMVADTATQIPLRDLEFSKRQEKGQTVYDVTLPNDKYTGPVFMPRLDENGLQAKMEDGKPAYDILYYNDGNLDPNQSFVAPEGTPPKGAKSTIKSEDREKILEASKKRDIEKQAGLIAQSVISRSESGSSLPSTNTLNNGQGRGGDGPGRS